MTDYLELASPTADHGVALGYGPGDADTLQHLLKVCKDAADAATRFSELLTLDSDVQTANVFREISVERTDFAQRLALMLADRGRGEHDRPPWHVPRQPLPLAAPDRQAYPRRLPRLRRPPLPATSGMPGL